MLKYTSKRIKLHGNFQNFLGDLSYAPEPPSIYVQLMYN